jgi:hypothetical protein
MGVRKARGPSAPSMDGGPERPRFKPSSRWAKGYDRDERTLMIGAWGLFPGARVVARGIQRGVVLPAAARGRPPGGSGNVKT